MDIENIKRADLAAPSFSIYATFGLEATSNELEKRDSRILDRYHGISSKH